MERLVHGEPLVRVERVRTLGEQLGQQAFLLRCERRVDRWRMQHLVDVGAEVGVQERGVAPEIGPVEIVVDARAEVPEQRVERLTVLVAVAAGNGAFARPARQLGRRAEISHELLP